MTEQNIGRAQISQGRSRSPMLALEYVPEGIPSAIRRSERIHSSFRPLIIAWHEISKAITGADGIKEDFRKLRALRLSGNLQSKELTKIYVPTIPGNEQSVNRSYNLYIERPSNISGRLHQKLGPLYKLAEMIHQR